MTKYKLRLLVPTNGRLANKDNWNVYAVLEAAGLGKVRYEMGDGGTEKVYFDINDPEIEVLTRKPWDIPQRIADGINYGVPNICGITGRDLAMERDFKIVECLDFKCGYVDLVFATKKDRWEEAANSKETMKWVDETRRKILGYNESERKKMEREQHQRIDRYDCEVLTPTNLDAFIAYIFNKKNRGREVKDIPVVCGTEYPNLGNMLWKRCPTIIASQESFVNRAITLFLEGKMPDVEIRPSRGQTEAFLKEGADMILENMATGKSLREKECVPLAEVFSSTARLYASRGCETGKLREVAERIDAVLEDMNDYCQVEFYWKTLDQGSARGLITKLNSHPKVVSAEVFQIDREVGAVMVVDKKDLAEIAHFMKNDFIKSVNADLADRREDVLDPYKLEQFRDVKLGEDTPFAIKGYELKPLYCYCPLRKSSVAKEGKYPPASSGFLRPEHREKTLLFLLSKNNTFANPEYEEILRDLDNPSVVQG